MQVKITFQGMRNTDNWNHFAWLVNINGIDFEYRTGTGHGVPKTGKGQGVRQSLWESERPNKRPPNSVDAGTHWACIPGIDGVLECLFSDAQSGAESFNEFCDNCGYSSDSLKALDTYRACMDAASKLRRALGATYETERVRVESLNQ